MSWIEGGVTAHVSNRWNTDILFSNTAKESILSFGAMFDKLGTFA